MNPNSTRSFAIPTWAWMILIGLTMWKVWIGPIPQAGVAHAQIPDSAAQRRLLIDELRRTNQLLTQIDETIRNHTIKVRIIEADKTPADRVRGDGR